MAPNKYTKKELNKVIRAQLGYDANDLYTDKEMSCYGMSQLLNLRNEDEIQKVLRDRKEQVNMKVKIIDQLYEMEVIEQKIEGIYVSHMINHGLTNVKTYNCRKEGGGFDWKVLLESKETVFIDLPFKHNVKSSDGKTVRFGQIGKAGLLQGLGIKFFCETGRLEEGTFKDDVLTGYGKVIYEAGSLLVGTFKEGVYDGNGKYVSTTGSTFEGLQGENNFTFEVFDKEGDKVHAHQIETFKKQAESGKTAYEYFPGNEYYGRPKQTPALVWDRKQAKYVAYVAPIVLDKD